MKTALLSGDHEKALKYYHQAVKENYREVFKVLGAQLETIFSMPEQLRLDEVTDRFAKYRYVVTEGDKKYAYPMVFVKDTDGIWKILQY